MTGQDSARGVSLSAVAITVMLGGCAPHPAGVVPTGEKTAAASSATTSSATIKDANGKTTAELFRSKFPGVDVQQVPGGGIRIRIRNVGGRDESGDPIYIVDGAEIATPDGALYIDPNSIVKIEIDKGVNALYGIRGANGVVKITTKR